MDLLEKSGTGTSTVLFRNISKPIPLDESELNVLKVLNDELRLNLGPEEQKKIEGVKLIGREIFRRHLCDPSFFHRLNISRRSLGRIYLKLQGIRARVNPNGSFGADALLFG